MTIIASCGHKLKEWEDLGVKVELVGTNREGYNTLEYGTYCVDCALKMVGEAEAWRVVDKELVTGQIRQLLYEFNDEHQ